MQSSTVSNDTAFPLSTIDQRTNLSASLRYERRVCLPGLHLLSHASMAARLVFGVTPRACKAIPSMADTPGSLNHCRICAAAFSPTLGTFVYHRYPKPLMASTKYEMHSIPASLSRVASAGLKMRPAQPYQDGTVLDPTSAHDPLPCILFRRRRQCRSN